MIDMRKLLILLAFLLVLGTLAYLVRGWLAVDSCLDRGGSWDYEHRVCLAPETDE